MACEAPASAARWFWVGSIALIGFTAFEALAVGTVLPRAAAAFGATAEYSVAFGVQFAAMIAAVAAAGPWIDHSGVRAPLIAGGLLFAAGLTVVACAPAMAVLAAGRAVQGVGSGLLSVVLYAMAGRLVAAATRPRLFAAFSAAWVVPSLVGPALAGLAADTVGWRWVFGALAPPSLVALAATLRATAGLDEAAYRTASGAGRALVVPATVAAVATAVLQFVAPRSGTGYLVAGVVCLVVTIVAARRLLPPGTLRAARGLPCVVLVNWLVAGGFFAAEVYLPLYLVDRRAMTPFEAGSVMTGTAVAWAVAAQAQGRVSPSGSGRRRLPLVGSVVVAASIAGVGTAFAVGAPWPVVFGCWATAGLGMGLTYPSTSILVLALSDNTEQGASSAALKLSEAVGTAVAIAASGAVFARASSAGSGAAGNAGYAATMVVPLVFAVGAAVVAVRLMPRPSDGESSSPRRRRGVARAS